MSNVIDLEFFKKQLSCAEKYQQFLCNFYINDLPSYYPNNTLLTSLYVTRYGAVECPQLTKCLYDPANAKMGKIKPFKQYAEKLNESQYKAVCLALAMDRLMVLEGPPGTGKTTVIVEIIKQLKSRDKNTRVLITSQNHLAVDNVMRGFTEAELYITELARIKQKEDSLFSFISEQKIFDTLIQNSDGKVAKILHSFDDPEDDRFGNAYLRENLSGIVSDKSIVGVTCNSIPGCHFENGAPFDYVIVDEAGKLSFIELINIARFSKKLILIGDTRQLPSVLPDMDKITGVEFDQVDGFDKEGYDFLKNNNFIDALFASINPSCKTSLDKQFRMSNAIGTYISDTFYGGTVTNGRDSEVPEALNFITYSMKNKIEFDEQLELDDGERTPLRNEYEVSIIKKLLSTLLKDVDRNQIAIITPYANQAKLISEKVEEIDRDRIGTVDSFQGREFDFVIFSCTRSYGNPGFLDNERRINVAISRAKSKIYVIGWEHYILDRTENLKHFVEYKRNYTHPVTGKGYNISCKKWFATDEAIKPK